MTSKFIEGSKHPQMTKDVEQHFFGADKAAVSGQDAGKEFGLGGTHAWDTAPIGREKQQANAAPTGAPPGPSIFNDNIAKPLMPKETGVNYTNRDNAGHTQTAKPFQGAADGMPGNAKMLWD